MIDFVKGGLNYQVVQIDNDCKRGAEAPANYKENTNEL